MCSIEDEICLGAISPYPVLLCVITLILDGEWIYCQAQTPMACNFTSFTVTLQSQLNRHNVSFYRHSNS